MPSDALHDGDGLRKRVQAVLESRTRLVTLRDSFAQDLSTKEAEVLHLNSEVEILSKVSELFKALMDQLVEKQVRSVEKIVNEGLATVFPKEGLTLEADVDPKYNQVSVDFFFRKGLKEDPRSYRDKPLAAFGGGTSSFVSLILRVLAVKKLKLFPLLILDESLGAISSDNIDSTGQFVRMLSEKLGFDVILVTHKPAFLDHAHSAYRCSKELEADGVSTYVSMKKVA